MKVEVKETEGIIDWNKPQVVVGRNNERVQVITNEKPTIGDHHYFCGVDLSTGELFRNLSKSYFISETKQDFPIKFEITVEDEKELCNLWHRMNTASKSLEALVNQSFMSRLKHGPGTNGTKFWIALNDLVEQYNLKKQC